MPDYPFAVIELCQCFPDDLHIADVELSDIRRKLEQPQNGIGARGYHGLGVFGDLLDGVKMVAKERGLSRSEEHTSELKSLMRISYAVFCLNKKIYKNSKNKTIHNMMT